jgi:hypothetical protein
VNRENKDFIIIKTRPITTARIIKSVEKEFTLMKASGLANKIPLPLISKPIPRYLLTKNMETNLVASSNMAGKMASSISFIKMRENIWADMILLPCN